MRKFFYVLLSAAIVLVANAVGSTSVEAATDAKLKKAKKCLFPKFRKRAPTWICDAHADGLAVAAVGSAVKSGAGIAFMEQMAAADARTHLARNLSGAVQGNITGSANADDKDMTGRDSALIIRITDESLQGTKVVKSAYGPDGTLYVLVGLDEASAQKLREAIAADYQQQKRK